MFKCTKFSLETPFGFIPFILRRSSKRRTIQIRINEEAQVLVAAPLRLEQNKIEGFIKQKADWIIEKRGKFEEHHRRLQKRKFEHSHEFLFLGKPYRLLIEEDYVKRVHLKFDGDAWQVIVPTLSSIDERQALIKAKLIQWYRREAEEFLASRVFHYARLMGVEPKTIAVRTQKRVWGNCHYHTKTIHFNWQIIFSPKEVIDYVVVHELAHLIVPNHSANFWKNVEKILPDFKQHKEWLKKNSFDMTLP